MNYTSRLRHNFPGINDADYEIDVYPAKAGVPGREEEVVKIINWNEAKLGPAPDLAALPDPPVFAGETVFSAADVDRVTARRIRDLLAPQWAGDEIMQQQAMSRALEDAVWANNALADPASSQADKDKAQAIKAASLTLRGQIQALRDEGAAFKAGRGW